MAKFKLYSDGKFRLATSAGLFTADASKHTIEEVNAAYAAKGGFTAMPFTTKDGSPVFCIANKATEVGTDVADRVITAKAEAQEVLQIKWTEV